MSTAVSDNLLEYAFTTPKARTLRVDREKGVVHGVKILGSKSRNGNLYTDQAMADAAGLYEGVPVYDGHHTRKYSDHVADLHDAYVEGNAVYGDLHLRRHHALYEQILDDAEHRPENLALSHEVMKGNYESTMLSEGRQVDRIHKVDAVAIVKHGGTNNSLLEEDMSKPAITSLEQLKENYPDLVEQLESTIAEGLQSQQQNAEKLARVVQERDEAKAKATELQEKLDLIEEERRIETLKAEILEEARELGLAESQVNEDLMEGFLGMKREAVTTFLKEMKPLPSKSGEKPSSDPGHITEEDDSSVPFYKRGK